MIKAHGLVELEGRSKTLQNEARTRVRILCVFARIVRIVVRTSDQEGWVLRIYVRIVRTKVRTPVPCPGDSGLNPGESGFNHVLVLFKLFLVFGAKVKHLSFV